MIGLPGYLSRFIGSSDSAVGPIALDVGSSQTRIAVAGKIVFNEPTCIVVHSETGAVIAIGKKAQALVGKASRQLEVIFPIQAGVIASQPAFELYLSAVLKQVGFLGVSLQSILGTKGVIGVPASSSPVEKNYFSTSLSRVGLGRVQSFPQEKALFQRLVVHPSLAQSYCLIDIGAQKTQIMMFSTNELVHSTAIRWGGIMLTEAVQDHIRAEHECTISWHEAEKVKLQVGQLASDTVKLSREKVAVRGKDVVSQVSKTVVVDSTLFIKPFETQLDELYDNLENFFSQIPSDVVTSALEHGMYLTGGTSQLPNLSVVLAERLQAPMMVSKNPADDVISGLIV